MPPTLSPEAADATQTLQRLAYELSQREKVVKERLDYYEGKHTLRFASPEFQEFFGARFKGFADNWTAPVINSPAERMNVLGMRLDDGSRGVDRQLESDWRSSDCDRGMSETVTMVLAAGRGFATVWGDENDDPTVDWERPDQAVVQYGDRGQRVAGLKLWRDDQHEFATLYTPSKVWKFFRLSVTRDGRLRSGLVLPSTAIGGWQPRDTGMTGDDTWPLPNPLGEVPLVELQNHSLLDRDNPLSDITGVAAMQDAINLIWAYLFNALDFASLPQRIVTGADMPTVPILDDNGQVIGRRPVDLNSLIHERILWIPNATADTAEWSAAKLDVFSAVIEHAIEHIAAQTRTPPHYLIGKIQNVAAEALTAAETGLVSKTGERIVYVNPGVREIFRLMALARGDEAKAQAVRGGTVMWADVQFRALGQKVDALQKLRTMGFPFEWIAEQYGLSPTEVRYVMKLREKEARQDAESMRALGGALADDATGVAPQMDDAPA